MESENNGFTLIEILIVVAIIALIGTMSAVAVNTARSKQRDATRLSNVRLVQSALEDYFNENNMYPVGDMLPLGDASVSACLGLSGFAGDCSNDKAIIMSRVPRTFEDSLEGIVNCGQPTRPAFCFTQLKEGDGYVVHFELENGLPAAGLQQGVNCATQDGMEAGTCVEKSK